MSEVTNEWLEAQILLHQDCAREDRSHRFDATGNELMEAALRELLSRRAADEGAVTVEGYADLRVFNDSPWNTLRCAANMLRVFMEGIDGDIPVTVTIRKAKP